MKGSFVFGIFIQSDWISALHCHLQGDRLIYLELKNESNFIL